MRQNDRFSQRVLFVRSGPGPELTRPHSLFEVKYSARASNWLIDANPIHALLAMVDGRVDREEIIALERVDIFSAFAGIVLVLQRHAGINVGGSTIARREPGLALVAIEHIWPRAASMAGVLAQQLIEVMTGARTSTRQRMLDKIERFRKRCSFSTFGLKYLYSEALSRDIPVQFIFPNSLLFGYGKHKQLVKRSMTERTPRLAVSLASNKSSTIDALRFSGLPVPRHIPVNSLAEAESAVHSLGYPVVVKPVDTDKGVGITAGVSSLDELRLAYRHAKASSDLIAVEQFIPGDTVRLLVIGGRFVAACRTQPPEIVGDGIHTIGELVDELNASPLRGPGDQRPLSYFEWDEEARGILQASSLSQSSVLPVGKVVRLRTTSNLSRGGESISVNDSIHPDNKKMAEMCARVIGLDIAGIDFRIAGIEKSWKQTESGVIEVNPNPGLKMHIRPAQGPSADVAGAVFDLLFPDRGETRIPIVAVTGVSGNARTVGLIADMLSESGLAVGSVSPEGVKIGDRLVSREWSAISKRLFMASPVLDVAVVATDFDDLIEHGLCFDRCCVTVVTRAVPDEVGVRGGQKADELVGMFATIAKAASTVVINADDSLCLSVRSSVADRRIILFSAGLNNRALADHVSAGGLGYELFETESEMVVVRREGTRSDVLANLPRVLMTSDAASRYERECFLASLAAVDCLGIEAR